MRVLICGGRNYANRAAVKARIAQLPKDTIVVHGAARGADSLAGSCARECGLEVEEYPASWAEFGKRAGFLRNQEMLASGIDLVIAFPGGNGTAHMTRIARASGVQVEEIRETQGGE